MVLLSNISTTKANTRHESLRAQSQDFTGSDSNLTFYKPNANLLNEIQQPVV